MSAGIRDALEGRGIALRRYQLGEHWAPCPECDRGPRDDALAIRIDHDGACWFCHRCEWTGAAGHGGEQVSQRRDKPAPPCGPERHETLSPYGLSLWEQCSTILPGTPAYNYLDWRCCIVPPGDLRWHTGLPYYVRDRKEPLHVGPALVALVTDVLTGDPISLHRTWIAPDGRGKAELGGFKARKLLWNHRSDGVIRLWPDDEVTMGLAIGEGIETCLAAAADGVLPVWATISAGNLAAFPVVPGLEGLTILVDHDRPNPKTGRRAGHEAASAVVERYTEAGFNPDRDIRVIISPIEGEDFADMAAKRRRAA